MTAKEKIYAKCKTSISKLQHRNKTRFKKVLPPVQNNSSNIISLYIELLIAKVNNSL